MGAGGPPPNGPDGGAEGGGAAPNGPPAEGGGCGAPPIGATGANAAGPGSGIAGADGGGGLLIGCIMVAAKAGAAGGAAGAGGGAIGAGGGAMGAGGAAAGGAPIGAAPGGIIPMPPTMVFANAPGLAAAPPACTGPPPTGGRGTAGAAGAAGAAGGGAGSAGFCSRGETIIMVPLKRCGFAGPPAAGAAAERAVPHEAHFAASSAFWVPQLGQNIVESPPCDRKALISQAVQRRHARCARRRNQTRTERGANPTTPSLQRATPSRDDRTLESRSRRRPV